MDGQEFGGTDRSRRRFVGWGLGLTAAIGVSALPGVRSFAADVAAFVKGPPVPDVEPERLSEHVWMIYAKDGFPTPENRGMMANITFVRTQKGVVLLDCGSSVQIGEMALRMIRKVTEQPVVAIFVSHYHGDHYLGAQAFVEAYGADLPIYAHPLSKERIEKVDGNAWLNMMERFTNGATLGTRLIPPNRETTHGEIFDFGDVQVKIHHYGHAHTMGDLCMEVLPDRLTYVGDVAMDRRIANMDDGSYPGSLEFMDRLEQHAASAIWVPGHGRPGPNVLVWQRELFLGIWENAQKAAEEGLDPSEAKDLVLKDPRVASRAAETKGWDSNIGKYISLAVLEAEKRLLQGQ